MVRFTLTLNLVDRWCLVYRETLVFIGFCSRLHAIAVSISGSCRGLFVEMTGLEHPVHFGTSKEESL